MGRPDFPRAGHAAGHLAAALVLIGSLGSVAQSQATAPAVSEPVADEAIVSGGTSSGGQGRIAVNVASGDLNQQAAAAVIATGGGSVGVATLSQHQDAGPFADRSSRAVIDDGAFAGSRGLISVNVAAGSGNQEANFAAIATGIEGLAVTDIALSQTRASSQPSGGPAQPGQSNDTASLAPGAFKDAQGLVQVNLIGGERNSSANIFALTVSVQGN